MVKKKQLKLTESVKIFLIAAFAAGAFSGFIVLGAVNSDDSTMLYTVGERISKKGFEVTLNSSRVEQIDEPYSGMTLSYVVVDLSITNRGNESLPFIPVFQSYIRTLDGVTYDMSPLPGIQPIYAGDISPGTTVTGELSYSVPSADASMMFFFDPSWNQEEAIFIEL